MIDYSEKRDFIRMTMACEMQIHDRATAHTELVHLEDLSASGMRFFSSRELAEGQTLDVTISPARDITPPMQAQITVIRCQAEADGRFDVAAAISDILPADYAEAEAV